MEGRAMAAALSTRSLEELKKEPWRLQIQAENTAEQLRNLVLKNYHVFIQSNQCASIVKDDLTELKDETTRVAAAIPELQRFCAQFQRQVADVVAKHGDIQFVFDHYIQLTELLEIPQLLEACIHNELFDSALDVIQFANDTFQADSSAATATGGPVAPNVIIDCLVREVAEMAKVMREKLLQKLRDDLQLALCVRIVSYLRRLDALSGANVSVSPAEYEKQLKEEFLSCRNVWLSSLTRGISTSDPYQYVVQVIDVKRTSWFDMITQYSAIFGSENVHGKVDPPLCQWATTTVANFIQILMKQLPKIEDFSSIATILEQSLFFGSSLGRVGVDFRAVLVVYFENHVVDLMTEHWRGACRDFQENLFAHSLKNGGSSSSSFVPASSRTPIVIASYRSGSSGSPFTASLGSQTSTGEVDYAPPRCLMSFPLLAEFTNAMLTSLNELRLCTIASLRHQLSKKFQSAICTMLLAIADFVDENELDLHPSVANEAAGNSEEASSGTGTGKQLKVQALASSVRDMNQVILSELVPYLIKCFQRLFPVPAAFSAVLHLSYFEEIMQEGGLLPAKSGREGLEQEALPSVVSAGGK